MEKYIGIILFISSVASATYMGHPVKTLNGGTQDSSLTSHGVLVGEGTSPVNVTAAGTTNQVLQSNGTSSDPTYTSTIASLTLSACTLSGTTPIPNGVITSAGKLGIGTTGPLNQFEIVATGNAQESITGTTIAAIVLNHMTTNDTSSVNFRENNIDQYIMGPNVYDNSGFFEIGNGLTPFVYINSSGNLGIGTSATTGFNFNLAGTFNASGLITGTYQNPSPSALGGIESLASATHKWINAISTSGVPSATQPAFTDISGSVASTQLPNPTASTLGGVESLAAITHNFLTSISTSGAPTQAQPACGDLSNSVASCSTDTTNASNISSGTLSDSRLPTSMATKTFTGTTTFPGSSAFTSAGNLGVGIAAATAPLHIVGPSGGVSAKFTDGVNNTLIIKNDTTGLLLQNGASTTWMQLTQSNNLVLQPSSGNVGIGVAPAGVFQVANLPTALGNDFVCATTAGIFSQDTTCITSSKRFKDNIKSVKQGLGTQEVMALRPVEFNKKQTNPPNKNVNSTTKQLGLIAEEVEAIDPRLALYEQDGKTPRSYRTEAVLAIVIQAFKEEHQRADNLEERIKKLESLSQK